MSTEKFYFGTRPMVGIVETPEKKSGYDNVKIYLATKRAIFDEQDRRRKATGKKPPAAKLVEEAVAVWLGAQPEIRADERPIVDKVVRICRADPSRRKWLDGFLGLILLDIERERKPDK